MKSLQAIAVLAACVAPGACASMASNTAQGARGVFTGQGYDARPIIHQNATGERATSVDLVRQVLCVTRGEENKCPDWRSAEWRTLTMPSADEAALEFEMHAFNADPAKDAEARKRYRNAIVGTVLSRADANCAAYLNQLRGWQVSQRTGLGIVEIGLDAAGAITQSTTSSRLFSGLSGVATSMAGTIDREVFSSTAVEVVANHIETSMGTARTKIVSNLSLTYTEYNLSLAIADLQRYYGGCDSRNGLAIMRAQGATKTDAYSADARNALAARAIENSASNFTNSASEARQRAAEIDLKIVAHNEELANKDTPALKKAELRGLIVALTSERDYQRRQANTLNGRAEAMRATVRVVTAEPSKPPEPAAPAETPVEPEPVAQPISVQPNTDATPPTDVR